ncbi:MULTISPECIES: TIGR02922 family protein [unclassified Thalassotalea]|uniref:TIGR02922 family protein n=1 Tax=unclassified Thalassotalea TaxID=2614972 RepID=UPI001081A107|nr:MULTISPECIES: TIGR02922 family protein [unclassified Thalassotalea]NMP15229.1 TIGR02922 family protein [Thalassotalea sp. Y01]QBY03785.1 TIGR02922 family protein [Thalassotalea sp. HSM 43]
MQVTVIYYETVSLELLHDVIDLEVSDEGKVIIPVQYKQGKSIISVYKGELNIINKVGERMPDSMQHAV